MDKKMRVAVVGFGYWGPNLVRNVASLANLVAICDESPANLNKAKELYPHVLTFGNVEDLLGSVESLDLDAVVVATPAQTHYQIASAVIAAGKHCFVEKPLTLKAVDSVALIREAKGAGVVLMVGHLLMYHSAVNWIRDYIDSGELGDVLYAYMQRLNLGKVRKHENAFWSLAAHDVSVLNYLIGEAPIQVSAKGMAILSNGIQDVVFANLTYPSGKMANIHVSWLDPNKVRKLTVVGTKKMLVFDDMSEDKIWIYDKGVGEPKSALAYGEDLTLRFGDIWVPRVNLSEPLAAELSHFLECCKTGATPRSDGQNGLEVVRVLEAVDASMNAGGTPVECEARDV